MMSPFPWPCQKEVLLWKKESKSGKLNNNNGDLHEVVNGIFLGNKTFCWGYIMASTIETDKNWSTILISLHKYEFILSIAIIFGVFSDCLV